jgi:type I restriction-modification system DNA methylase subunit
MSQATLAERPYLNSNLFSSHYLDERLEDREEWDCEEAAREAMGELQSLYADEGSLVAGYNEDPLIDNWIDEVLTILGFGTQVETTLPEGGGYVDALLFEDDAARRDAAEVYLSSDDTTDLFAGSVGLVEAKQWDADFTEQFSEQRQYRNASHQIKHYLERTPGSVRWGILTNGRKWRLYGTKDYETQTYYEVDLPELLERGDLEAFKYFYAFFRPAAFRESAGETFLDTVWAESETASQELGEDLQDNVFTALRVLGRGFLETNDLGIDPADEAALDELKEQSLVLLYRLMFVLYAESRGLIDPDGPEATAEYDQEFSLDTLRSEIHEAVGETGTGFDEEFSEFSTRMWSRLDNLFGLVDEGEASLGIPPYNGGLFDREQHAFLDEHQVSNRYLAEVIYRLSTVRNEEGRYVLADYGDLDTRHLGSVYEGLLEHQFRIAPEEYAAVADDGSQVWEPATEVSVADAIETVPEGGLYVVNDDGERKATGAYYTPDYVVTYIVEETVGPLIEEIREDLLDQGFERGTQEYLGPFLRRVTDLDILDPAMGSGHFLTTATGFLAEAVMGEVREIDAELGYYWDEQYVRREIAKECIYGVDRNGMAVELAKLSMWLETLAADRPLAFLDHHFKTGNSLVGSDIEDIEELESDAIGSGNDGNDGTHGDDEQSSLATFGATREGTIERLMEIYRDFLAIDNEDLDDVKRMERKYREIEQDDLRQRLVAMANVRTAEDFGLDVPGGAYERMARALESDSEWADVEEQDWFRSSQVMAEEQDFFHWKLEFPEVFYDKNGAIAEQSGFGSVVGNPPYIRIQNFRQTSPEAAEYLTSGSVYESANGRFDIYSPFVEQGASLSAEGTVCYILPNKFVESGGGKSLRKFLVDNRLLNELLDFRQHQVFEGATTYTCILSLRRDSDTFDYVPVEGDGLSVERLHDQQIVPLKTADLSEEPWTLTTPGQQHVLDLIEGFSTSVGSISKEVLQGMKSGDNNALFVECLGDKGGKVQIRSPVNDQIYEVESEMIHPIILGKNIHRYESPDSDLRVIYPYTISQGETSIIPESTLESDYPCTYKYLDDFRERLTDRQSEHMNYETWYALNRPRQKSSLKVQRSLYQTSVNDRSLP